MLENNNIKPFLKWAGGKRWLTNRDYNLFPQADEYNNYFEPFLGSGAVFFHLKPKKSFLSDINLDLVNAYNAIKTNPKKIMSLLREHHNNHSKEYYYKIRSLNYKDREQQVARFIYLNRTCWNGLYRVNNSGKFNVPIGTKTKVILESDNFVEMSAFLKNADISKIDFEEAINKAQENDFVFIDPPYTVKHNLNGFIKYNETLFSWNDQIRLKDCIIKAIDRGVKVLITNANHDSVKSLYKDLPINISCLSRSSVLASSPEKRGKYEELVIKCGY